jgi:hypothetical protein
LLTLGCAKLTTAGPPGSVEGLAPGVDSK